MNLKEFIRHPDWLSLLVAFIAVNNVVAITVSFGTPYYIFMFCILVACLIKGGIREVNPAGIFFFVAIILSIITNNIPDEYRPWLKFITLLILILLIGPILGSARLYHLRINAFNLVFIFLQPVIILSFIGYILGIAFTSRHDFAGIMVHSMVLGPTSGILTIYCCYRILSVKTITIRCYYIGLMLMSFLTMMLSASRGAFLATSFAILIFVLLKTKFRGASIIQWAVLCGLAILATSNLWMPYTNGLVKKNDANIAAGGMTNSREVHWRHRIEEFKSSPIFGIGFSRVFDYEEATPWWYNRFTQANMLNAKEDSIFQAKSVEPGSSWLAVLSMTGILGFVCFIYFFINAIRELNFWKRRNRSYFILCAAMLAFWSVHMLFEGYALNAGGFLFFNLWLLLGVINAMAHQRSPMP